MSVAYTCTSSGEKLCIQIRLALFRILNALTAIFSIFNVYLSLFLDFIKNSKQTGEIIFYLKELCMTVANNSNIFIAPNSFTTSCNCFNHSKSNWRTHPVSTPHDFCGQATHLTVFQIPQRKSQENKLKLRFN